MKGFRVECLGFRVLGVNGITENKVETTIVYWGYIRGMLDALRKASFSDVVFKAQGLGCSGPIRA